MAAMMEHAAQPVASPEPSRPDEPWRMVVKELLRTLPHDSPARGWLADSELAATGQVDGVPVYQVQLSNSAGVSWIRDRFGVRLRREVSALVGTQVLVEVVA